jgi:hypothetical protein
VSSSSGWSGGGERRRDEERTQQTHLTPESDAFCDSVMVLWLGPTLIARRMDGVVKVRKKEKSGPADVNHRAAAADVSGPSLTTTGRTGAESVKPRPRVHTGSGRRQMMDQLPPTRLTCDSVGAPVISRVQQDTDCKTVESVAHVHVFLN